MRTFIAAVVTAKSSGLAQWPMCLEVLDADVHQVFMSARRGHLASTWERVRGGLQALGRACAGVKGVQGSPHATPGTGQLRTTMLECRSQRL